MRVALGGTPQMTTLRIAQAQINVTVGDLTANVDRILEWMDRAKAAGADIVTFPELSLCGYPPEDLLMRPRFLRDNRLMLDKLAGDCRGITAVVGFADSQHGKVYNAAALIRDGVVSDVYRKIELPNYGVFDEKRYFDEGDRGLVFEMGGRRFSVTVCEDVWIPGSPTEKFALEGTADTTLNISASPFHAGKLTTRYDVVARFARATNTTVFFNNLVGGQDELVFDGGSLVVDNGGTLAARAKRFEEDLLLTDMETKAPKSEPPGDSSGAESSKAIPLQAPGSVDRADAASSMLADMHPMEEIFQALVLGTRDYVRKNGFRKVVLGLSGGIDSALTAVVAVEALGKGNVIGVTMPSQYTSEETFSDAGVFAANLGIKFITVPIKTIYKTYLDELAEPFGEGTLGVEAENLQARIRGNILMALSNRFGWLVLATGNKSETAVGYCTLYGDMAGGFAVIKDVPKTVVYELSTYLNTKFDGEIIPASVIERPPTAELRPDQKDEDSLPAYEMLDPILRSYVEEFKARDEIVAQGFDLDIVEDVTRLVDRNEYKRRQAPPGVKITPKAFGRDRRMPITNRYSGRNCT
jgi:NAD+ synthase (glutamine-hydrolysing)